MKFEIATMIFMCFCVVVALFIVMSVTGCSSNRQPELVKIPVPVEFEPPYHADKPPLPISNISKTSSSSDYVRSITASLHLCVSAYSACETQLQSYDLN